MKIRVTGRVFDEMREAIGKDEVVVDLDSEKSTVNDFLDHLYKKYGKKLEKANVKKSLICDGYIIQVNGRSVVSLKGLMTTLSDGDVISFLPAICV